MWSPLKRVRGLFMEVYDVILLNVIIWIPLESRLGSLRQKTLTPTVNDPNSRNSWRLKRFVFHGFLFYRLLHNFITWWSFFRVFFVQKKIHRRIILKIFRPSNLCNLNYSCLRNFYFVCLVFENFLKRWPLWKKRQLFMVTVQMIKAMKD